MSRYVKRWNIPVPEHLDELLKNYLEDDAYQTKSEFIRVAVRDRLEVERKKLEASKKRGKSSDE